MLIQNLKVVIKFKWPKTIRLVPSFHNSWTDGPLEERKISTESSQQEEPSVNNKNMGRWDIHVRLSIIVSARGTFWQQLSMGRRKTQVRFSINAEEEVELFPLYHAHWAQIEAKKLLLLYESNCAHTVSCWCMKTNIRWKELPSVKRKKGWVGIIKLLITTRLW